MASPTIDGVTFGTVNSTNTATLTLTTSNANDVILVSIGYELAATQRDVVSVTASGLTFTRRFKVANASASHETLELWWAPSTGALTSKVITITWDANIDDACQGAFGVSGCANISAPFDTNVSLPASSTTGTSPTATFSTDQTNNLLLGFGGGVVNNGLPATPAGWTNVFHQATPAAALAQTTLCDKKAVSATQSSATYQNQLGVAGVSAIDALTADSSSTASSLSIAVNTFAWNAQNVSFGAARNLSLDTQTYLWTAQTIVYPRSLSLHLDPQTYVWTAGDMMMKAEQFRTISFAELNADDFTDWSSTAGGTTFISTMNACVSLDDPSLKTQTPYVYTFMKEGTSNNQGAFMEVDWDWITEDQADDGSPRHQEPTQIYAFRNGLLVGAKKNKVRGKGRSVHLRFTSDGIKDFNILGWSVFYSTLSQQ